MDKQRKEHIAYEYLCHLEEAKKLVYHHECLVIIILVYNMCTLYIYVCVCVCILPVLSVGTSLLW